MKTILINPAWDAAGVSIRQAKAINKYTNWESRHFRTIPTFGYDTDITPENYNVEEFVELIKESDIIHFCSATYDYNLNHMNWGFDWREVVKNKKIIFHDYCSFPGHWRERANAKDYWEAKTKIRCDAIFSSIPQAVHIYKDCIYIPDIVDEQTEEFNINPNRLYDKIHLGHFSTGGSNNKNTDELREALNRVRNIDALIPGSSSLRNSDVINFKQNINLGFDALWREYHGMTTVENLALGIPTMCNISEEFFPSFNEYLGTDFNPFEITKTIEDIVKCLEYYSNNLDKLKERSIEIRKFMEEHWSANKVINKMVKEYEKL